MARRSQIMSHECKGRLLAAMKETRRRSEAACAETRIGSPQYRALEALHKAIDDAAEALTGDREALWRKWDTSVIR